MYNKGKIAKPWPEFFFEIILKELHLGCWKIVLWASVWFERFCLFSPAVVKCQCFLQPLKLMMSLCCKGHWSTWAVTGSWSVNVLKRRNCVKLWYEKWGTVRKERNALWMTIDTLIDTRAYFPRLMFSGLYHAFLSQERLLKWAVNTAHFGFSRCSWGRNAWQKPFECLLGRLTRAVIRIACTPIKNALLI